MVKLCKRALFLFLFLFLFLHSSCSADLRLIPNAHNSGFGDDGSGVRRTQSNLDLQVPERRSLAISEGNSSFILAAERTHRKDPSNGFKIYTGGWNISDDHYWASVAFSAAPVFATAAAWFVIFGIVLFFMICCFCCYPDRKHSYSFPAYVFSLALLSVFTVTTIFGCILLYDGQERFHRSTTSTTDYVLRQASDTVSNLRALSDNLNAAKSVGLDQLSLPSDLQLKIDQVVTKINGASDELDSRVNSNSDKIADVLNTMRTTLIIITAATLLLTSLAFLFSICGLQSVVYILVIIGWILIACTLLLCGVFLLLHNIVSDTCVAMDEWVQHPQDHTALDDILPCVDPAMTAEAIRQSKFVTYQILDILNSVIANVSNKDFQPQAVPLYYNQSGPLVPELCNPYSADLSPRTCATQELQFDNAGEVWKGYTCKTATVSGSEICTTVGRLTPTFYHQLTVAANISFGLYHYGPYLSDLADCNFVRRTFKSLSDTNCPGLRRYSGQVYIGLLIASVAVMVSLISSVVHARERRHRKHAESFVRLDKPFYQQN